MKLSRYNKEHTRGQNFLECLNLELNNGVDLQGHDLHLYVAVSSFLSFNMHTAYFSNISKLTSCVSGSLRQSMLTCGCDSDLVFHYFRGNFCHFSDDCGLLLVNKDILHTRGRLYQRRLA